MDNLYENRSNQWRDRPGKIGPEKKYTRFECRFQIFSTRFECRFHIRSHFVNTTSIHAVHSKVTRSVSAQVGIIVTDGRTVHENTLETSVEDEKNTLETSGEDGKNTLETSG